ncbi:MAG: glycyl radical protein [Coriobacteriales bacterium]|jgi:pyruvate formate-lyase/glycerol dehydratase family glycyl radical enzyme
MISDTITAANRPEAIEPYDKVWGVGVSGLDEEISPFPRINRMLERAKSAKSRIDTQRMEIITESYKKSKGQPQIKRVAQGFHDIIEKCDVRVGDDEIILGEIAAPAFAAPIYPEFSINFMIEEMDAIDRGEAVPFEERNNDKYYITDEQKAKIRELAPAWDNETVYNNVMAQLGPEEKKGAGFAYFNDLYATAGIGHISVDYPMLLKLGWKGIKARIDEQLAKLELGTPEAIQQRTFWEAQLISVDASMLYFRRYGEKAAEVAAECTDPQRKAELERMSANCLWVSENPPRDFWEAIQLWWGATNLILIESNGHSVTYGRFDQFMGPFYENDIKNGTLTREFMQELIECSFLKMDELRKWRDYFNTIIASGIGWGGTALNVGGVKPDGTDGVNDVSYMVLDAHAHTRITNPWMGVKLSEKNPEEFWIKTFNVCRIGTGEPKVYNDDLYYKTLSNYGVPVEQARDWVGIGCVEPEVPGYTYGWHDADYYNCTKVFLLAINNGETFEGEKVGAETGYLTDMKSFDEVKQAFDIQMKYWCDRMLSTINTMDLVHQRVHPLPYLSLLVHDCTERGVDISAGGARFNYSGPQCVGLGTVTDSLCTIKQLIFEEGKITAEELMEALKANWEGHEVLQAMVNSDLVHHYGNDDDYADEIAKFVIDTYCKHVEHRPNARGGEFRPGVYSVSINVPAGMLCDASPDGRKAGEPVSDCLGPAHPDGKSHDIKGPLAIANSLAKLDQTRIANGVILNWKFTPETLAGEAGLDNFINLFKGYFGKGGLQSQFNVTSKETLEAAQKKPKDYRDLMVRVAGYSAYFTELSPELQSDLIGRTELSF